MDSRHEDGAVEVWEPQNVLEDRSETILSHHDGTFIFVEFFSKSARAARIVSADTLAPVPATAQAARASAADRNASLDRATSASVPRLNLRTSG
jgi:hypothetical protein